MIRKGVPRPLCPGEKSWWCWDREFNGRTYRVNLLLTLPITAGIGVFPGMWGVTGGGIKLPLVVRFCGVPMDIAIATSTVMVAVTALLGFAGHILVGNFQLSMIMPPGYRGFHRQSDRKQDIH